MPGIDFRIFFQPMDPERDTIFQEIARSLWQNSLLIQFNCG